MATDMSEKNFWIDKYKISSFNIDSNRKLSLNSICNFFQESAYHHAESHNFGYKSLVVKKWAWVLSKLYIKVNKYPVWNDEITLKTWSKGPKGILALRDFIIFDEKGESLVNGTSAWILFDFNISRPKKVSQELTSFPINEENALIYDFNKISELDHPEKNYSYTVKYCDIDVNRHVNNIKYIELILNCFSPDFFKENSIQSLEINFLSESFFNDKVIISCQTVNKDKEYLINCINEENNKEIFRARIAI